MNLVESIKNLSKAEKIIWFISLTTIVLSSCLFNERDILTIIASAIGATALIFVGKGDAVGQLLTIVFAIIYAVISFRLHYYGEMVTYVGMTAPSALWAMIVWIKNPYVKREVRVAKITKEKWCLLFVSAIAVTMVMWRMLAYFNTANLLLSTISVTTSYLASMLTVLRSPYYAVCYAANDIILIVLWVLAAMVDISYFSMVLCFIIFLINDLYGFINWRKMKDRQDSR